MDKKITSRLENKLVNEIEIFSDKLIKDLKRNNKIIAQSDKRQAREYDKLQEQYTEIKELKQELEETQLEILSIMGSISESRSNETGKHIKRVAQYSYQLAMLYGLGEKEAIIIQQASPMHDLGKIAIPDAILNKPAKLDDEEIKIMKTHSQLGYDMLKHSTKTLIKTAATIAITHHERYDGLGYPNNLKGENIHIYGRITALADVFDALSSDRVYKKAWSDDEIFEHFQNEKGKHFDPKLIEVFFDNLDIFLEIRSNINKL